MEAKEVAEFLHLHLFTIHKLARQGRLPAFKIGNDWRFRKSSIDQWVKDKEKTNGHRGSNNHSPKR